MQIYFIFPPGVLFGNGLVFDEKGWEGLCEGVDVCISNAGRGIDRDFIPPALRLGK